jgi:hypothetical protein
VAQPVFSHPLRARLLAAALALLAAGSPAAGPAVLAVPEHGAYTGAYIEFGEQEDEVTLEAIEAFVDRVGSRQAIIAFASYWGRGRFPAEAARIVARSRAVPLILWNPWEGPADRRSTRFGLERILAGEWDGYIDAWAAGARAHGDPLLVSWGLEMNGDWYPWSGVYHGGGAPVAGASPAAPQGPATYVRAYRHVVDRVRAAGARNVSWVFHVNNESVPPAPWNRMAAYYPGGEYVDWLGMSAYGKQFPWQEWIGVDAALVRPCAELAAVDPGRPVLLAEWGVGEFPRQGAKGDWIREAFAAMRELPRLRGAVFWHERWQNADLSYSNLRVGSSLDALQAYREGVADPFWLATPLIERRPPPGSAGSPSR